MPFPVPAPTAGRKKKAPMPPPTPPTPDEPEEPEGDDAPGKPDLPEEEATESPALEDLEQRVSVLGGCSKNTFWLAA